MFAMKRADVVQLRQRLGEDTIKWSNITTFNSPTGNARLETTQKPAPKSKQKGLSKPTMSKKKPLRKQDAENVLDLKTESNKRTKLTNPDSQRKEARQKARSCVGRVDRRQRSVTVRQARPIKRPSSSVAQLSPQRMTLNSILDSIEVAGTDAVLPERTGMWNVCWLPHGMPVQTILSGLSYH
ncbi:uncharacterized protein PV09_03732 [Verruconis gallopava]|uniref:Uncharacterized protein n=1 Tax=Verruconis gallopava TaxID=253628 RepID=A0A0D2B1H1_9PEZI|nr:uncharacterized protein PV09_03732 [Verruconis gallopava]KIW05184.1 hypothetical protein PV09_03732 [Verruconis gallopava]